LTKILVIDDSTLMRRILRQYLEQAGFEVEDWLPLSAMEIPDRIASSAPDLVLSDYQMPGVNGLTVAKMVLKANPNIPVVILTAIREPETEASMRKFGVKRILSKPIDAESLVQAIKAVLAGS
jgi:two-component system chemotaxis response regulator CheY